MDLKQVLGEWSEKKKLHATLTSMAHESKMVEHIPSVTQYVEQQVAACVASFSDINDDEDMGYYVAIQYVELKARWIQMNLRLSYQAVTKGEGDAEMLLRAASISALLGIVEPHVSQTYVQTIQKLLTEPMFSHGDKNAA